VAKLEAVPVALPADAASRLAILRVATGLKLPDCCVLMAAQQVAGSVATFDADLARAAGNQGMQVLPG